jgi:hypothetical protein
VARSRFALPVAGLNPADPDVAPGSDLSLTPRQRRALEAALRQAPQPAHVLRLVREGLQQGRPLLRVLEDLRAAGALPVLRQYAVSPAPAPTRPEDARRPADAPRELTRAVRRPAPAPRGG